MALETVTFAQETIERGSELRSRHTGRGPDEPCSRLAAPPAPSNAEHAAIAAEMRAARLEGLASHLEMLFRFVRRMGFATGAAEDVAQEAFAIAAVRLPQIVPGKERAYLVSIAVNLVRRERTRAGRHAELDDAPASTRERPDALLETERARALLDRSLASLPDDLRAVFVLHEIEEETMADIATMLDVPPGTVASRLRRARDEWKKAVARLKREGTLLSGSEP